MCVKGVDKLSRFSQLWQFLQVLLNEDSFFHVIRWQDRSQGIFRIVDCTLLAQIWGHHKNIAGMTYDKMSRSMRNYYKTNKMRKVPGQRQVYQFLFSEENPPHLDPKIGELMDQCNEIKKFNLLKQGLESIPGLQKVHERLSKYRKMPGKQGLANKNPSEDPLQTVTSNEELEVRAMPLEIDIKEEPLAE